MLVQKCAVGLSFVLPLFGLASPIIRKAVVSRGGRTSIKAASRVVRGTVSAIGGIDHVARDSVVRKGTSVDSWGLTETHKKDDEAEKASVVRGELSKLCNLFPGNACGTLIKQARNKDASADQGVQLRSSLRRKMKSNKPFVFAAFGSSVTAGHDNYPNQSWPFELQRILNPTFEKLGFGFEMRQRALGGYGGGPFAAGCLQTRAGTGVDAISWEWWLFRDPKCIVHKFVQGAYSLNGNAAHAPVIFDLEQTHSLMKTFREQISETDAADVRKQFFKNSDLDGLSLHNVDERKALLIRPWRPNTWYLTEEHISVAEVGKWDQVNTGKAKFVQTMPKKARPKWASLMQSASDKPTEQQQAAVVSQAKATLAGSYPAAYLNETGAMQGFIEAGFGYEAFYASGGLLGVPLKHRPWYGAREKAFMMNWHPGPLGHLLIATQLAHYILEELLHMLQEDELQAAIPKMPVLSGECGGMTRSCFTGVSPHTSPHITSAIVKGEGWKQQQSIFQNSGNPDFLWLYSDHKMPLVGTAADPALVLRVTSTRPGDVVMVCSAPVAYWRPLGNFGFITASRQSHAVNIPQATDVASQVTKPVADVEYALDGQLVSDAKLNEMTQAVLGENGSFCPNCGDLEIQAGFSPICQPVAELTTGTHELSLKVRPSSPIYECNHTTNDKCVNKQGAPVHVAPRPQGSPETFVELLQMMVVPGPNSA